MNQHTVERDKVFETFFGLLGEELNAAACKLPRNDKRVYAATLVNNVRRQAYGIHQQLDGIEATSGRYIEIASVVSTGRLALETYLVFHHIFIDSDSEEESEFKYFAWILNTLKMRAEKYHIEHFEHLEEMPEGKMVMEHAKEVVNANPIQQQEVIELLRNNSFYKQLMASDDEKRKKRFTKRIEDGWFPKDFTPLMRAAGLGYFVNNHIYQWLSAGTHPSFHIIEACAHARTYEEQLEFASFEKSLLMTLMGKLCLEYPVVFPDAEKALFANPVGKALAEEITRRTDLGRPSDS